MYFPKPAINENDLAIIERGDTASHSIDAGQYVSWKGKLGKANAAILQGATLDDSLFSYETDGVINSLNNKIIQMDWDALSASDAVTLPGTYSPYTIPADGYILSQSYIGVELSNGNFYEFGSAGGALFVKKGMKVRKAGNSNSYEMKFFPVISK